MRNLVEYPVTAEEVLEVIQKLPMDNPPGTTQFEIGGLNDMIRHYLIKFVSQPENMDKIVQRMKA
jgi:hypothetical protein